MCIGTAQEKKAPRNSVHPYFCTVLYRDCDTAGNGQEPNVMLTPLFYGQTKTVRTSTVFWSPYCDQVVLLYLVQDTLYTNYALVTTTTTK